MLISHISVFSNSCANVAMRGFAISALDDGQCCYPAILSVLLKHTLRIRPAAKEACSILNNCEGF